MVVWLLKQSTRRDESLHLVRKPITGLWRLYVSVPWRPSASVNPSNSVYLSPTIIRTKRWNPRIYGVIRASRRFQTELTIRASDGYELIDMANVTVSPCHLLHTTRTSASSITVCISTHIPSWLHGDNCWRACSSSIPVYHAKGCYVTFCIPADNRYRNDTTQPIHINRQFAIRFDIVLAAPYSFEYWAHIGWRRDVVVADMKELTGNKTGWVL